MASDKLKVFKTRINRRGVWIIRCPVCKFDFERGVKHKAVEFAGKHKGAHEDLEIEISPH
jgi:hypothetical protein